MPVTKKKRGRPRKVAILDETDSAPAPQLEPRKVRQTMDDVQLGQVVDVPCPRVQDASVIIPAHKAVPFLADVIKSIEKQTERPGEILIGVDCDRETMTYLLEIVGKHRSIKIRPFWFPQHSWPYLIRNTLALHAKGKVLHFFDADDVMYPDHCELMGMALEPGRYMAGMGEMQDGDRKPVPWDRGVGVVSILRSEFIRIGGFEPWKCAADTEAQW